MFASTNFSALFIYMAHYGTLILLSFYLEIVRFVSPLTAGLHPDGRTALRHDLRAVRGWIASRTASRDPPVAGCVIATVSLLLLSTLTQTTLHDLRSHSFSRMLGAGVGIFAPTNTNANLASVPPGDRALANGILGMMRHTGQAISLAMGTILIGFFLYGHNLSAIGQGGTVHPGQYLEALSITFIVGAILSGIGAVFAYRGREPAQAVARVVQVPSLSPEIRRETPSAEPSSIGEGGGASPTPQTSDPPDAPRKESESGVA